MKRAKLKLIREVPDPARGAPLTSKFAPILAELLKSPGMWLEIGKAERQNYTSFGPGMRLFGYTIETRSTEKACYVRVVRIENT